MDWPGPLSTIAPAALGSSGAEVIRGAVFFSFPLRHTLSPARRMASIPHISGYQTHRQATAPRRICPSVPFHCYLHWRQKLSHDLWELANPPGTGVMPCPEAWDSISSSPQAPTVPYKEESCPHQHKGGRGQGWAAIPLNTQNSPCCRPKTLPGGYTNLLLPPAPSWPSKANKAKGSVVSDPWAKRRATKPPILPASHVTSHRRAAALPSLGTKGQRERR